MRNLIAVSTALALVSSSIAAQAFCGFYVSGSDKKMFADATNVVLMRAGTRTVLSMQNDYRGPLEDFAMVIPVPVVLKPTDVKVLEKAVFDRMDSLGSPRLVEYWEQDPCPAPVVYQQDYYEGEDSMDAPSIAGTSMSVDRAPAPEMKPSKQAQRM